MLAIFEPKETLEVVVGNAVQAALELNESLSAVVSRPENERGPELSLRQSIVAGHGIHSVVSDPRQEVVFGVLPFLAQRLMAAATPGDVLLNNAAGSAMRDNCRATPVGYYTLKGVPEPLAVWQTRNQGESLRNNTKQANG